MSMMGDHIHNRTSNGDLSSWGRKIHRLWDHIALVCGRHSELSILDKNYLIVSLISAIILVKYL